jgi:cystathionine beta-lyase/cystathionine gamma-synthase
MNLDDIAEWLERHPEIAEVIVTEIVTTTYPELPAEQEGGTGR